jgi:alkylation response protein AidB-like acyl-CoA dehydrogenase
VTLAEADGGWAVRGTIAAPPGAADADRCLCGARVDVTSRRRERVAVVAVDLTAAGVARPQGESDALTFDGVRVAEDEIVGERDQGWPVLQSVRARMRSVR